MNYLQYLVDSFVKAYYAILEILIVNFFWVVFTLLIVTAPGAYAGLNYAMYQLAKEQPVNWRTFFDGLRQYWWLGWRWTIMNVLVALSLVLGYRFYGNFDHPLMLGLRGIFLGVGVIWALLQMYTFPLLIAQSDKRLITALRNSAVLYIKYPRATWLVLLILLALGLVSIWLRGSIWLIFLGSFSTFLIARTVVFLVECSDTNS